MKLPVAVLRSQPRSASRFGLARVPSTCPDSVLSPAACKCPCRSAGRSRRSRSGAGVGSRWGVRRGRRSAAGGGSRRWSMDGTWEKILDGLRTGCEPRPASDSPWNFHCGLEAQYSEAIVHAVAFGVYTCGSMNTGYTVSGPRSTPRSGFKVSSPPDGTSASTAAGLPLSPAPGSSAARGCGGSDAGVPHQPAAPPRTPCLRSRCRSPTAHPSRSP